MALSIDLKPGEAISIGDAIVTLESKSGQVARLSVQVDKSVPVQRVQQASGVNAAAQDGITIRP